MGTQKKGLEQTQACPLMPYTKGYGVVCAQKLRKGTRRGHEEKRRTWGG